MATPKRIFTFSAGSQNVSLAEFRPGKVGGLLLHAFESRELLADPAADASRVAQAALALGEMVVALKAKDGTVLSTLPAQSTFSRMVKVPAMSGEDLAQTVMYEAKQNIPYPLEEVVWDYRVVYETQSHEPEVLISAAKADLLEEWTGAILGAKMTPAGMDLAAVALYNAFRYNYGEPEGCSLLIDLGARTTNLIFVEPGKFYIRTIASGGSALTTAVSKEFVESFSEAEARKVEHGFIGHGANFEEVEDPMRAKLAKVLRNAATRLHAEVTRSIAFYRSQQSGGAPKRVYLSGNGARLPMSVEFWQEKLGVPVEMFNPMRCIGVVPGTKVSALIPAAPMLGEHVGLALQTAFKCPVAVNLLPPALRMKSRVGQIALAIGLSAACVTAPIAAWGIHLQHNARVASEQTAKLAPEIRKAQELDRKIKTVREQIELRLKEVGPIEKAAHERRYWINVIEQIHASLPPELVWITSLELPEPEKAQADAAAPGKAGTVVAEKAVNRLLIKGLYLDNPRGVGVVDDFGDALVKTGKLAGEYHTALNELRKARAEGAKEQLELAEQNFQAVKDRLTAEKHPIPPEYFTVPPVEEWVRSNSPKPEGWAQDFTIPLDLSAPPSKSAVLTP